MKRKHTLTLLAFLIPLTAGATEAPGDLTNPYRTQVQTQVVAKSLDQITWSPAITDAGSFLADNTLIGQGTQTATGVNYQNHVSNSSGVIMSNMTSDECHGVLKADAGTSVIKVKLYGGSSNKQLVPNSGVCSYSTEANSSTYKPKLLIDGDQTVTPGQYTISLTPVRWI